MHENFGSGTGLALVLGEAIGLSDGDGDALASGDTAALVVALGVDDDTACGAPQPAIARTAIAVATSDLTRRA